MPVTTVGDHLQCSAGPCSGASSREWNAVEIEAPPRSRVHGYGPSGAVQLSAPDGGPEPEPGPAVAQADLRASTPGCVCALPRLPSHYLTAPLRAFCPRSQLALSIGSMSLPTRTEVWPPLPVTCAEMFSLHAAAPARLAHFRTADEAGPGPSTRFGRWLEAWHAVRRTHARVRRSPSQPAREGRPAPDRPGRSGAGPRWCREARSGRVLALDRGAWAPRLGPRPAASAADSAEDLVVREQVLHPKLESCREVGQSLERR